MARIKPRRNVATTEQRARGGGGEIVRIAVVIDDDGLPTPLSPGQGGSGGRSTNPREEETFRAITRAVQSLEEPFQSGDRLEIELEFTGTSYQAAEFAEAIEACLVENRATLTRENVARDLVKNQFLIFRNLWYNRIETDKENREIPGHGGAGEVAAGGGKEESNGQGTGDNLARDLVGFLASQPGEFDSAIEQLSKLLVALRQAAASHLNSIVNVHLAALEPKDLESKKAIATKLMAGLSRVGMALRCPVTGKPSHLLASGDVKNPKGRFHITPIGSSKPTVTRANLTKLLPVEVMEAHPRREALSEWRDLESARKKAASLARRADRE